MFLNVYNLLKFGIITDNKEVTLPGKLFGIIYYTYTAVMRSG